jgi:hypothetical protein
MGATYLGPLLPIGSVIHSMLTEAQFQAQAGSGWVLADGRGATGTVYNTITGASTIPDMRGRFLRAKNNGSSTNPDGDLALGTNSADKLASHTHGVDYGNNGSGSAVIGAGLSSSTSTQQTQATGGNETAPKSTTVNIFIRIN